MVTSLEGLRSTNSGGTKKVEVAVRNDAVACETTIDFLILGENHSQTVALGPEEVKFVERVHEKSGLSFVVATASGSMASTSKLLDLDAAVSQ